MFDLENCDKEIGECMKRAYLSYTPKFIFLKKNFMCQSVPISWQLGLPNIKTKRKDLV